MCLEISDWESNGRLRFQKLRSDPEVFRLAQLVVEARQVSMTRMLRPTRGSGHAASARMLAIYLAHVLLERPQDIVADLFSRGRSTVAHACQTMEDKRDHPAIEAEIALIEARLRESAPNEELRHAA